MSRSSTRHSTRRRGRRTTQARGVDIYELDARAQSDVERVMPGVSENGVIAIEMRLGWRLGVVLLAAADASVETASVTIAFAADRVETLIVERQPTSSAMTPSARLSKRARVADNPRRWRVSGNPKPDRTRKLIHLRNVWLTKVIIDGAPHATAAELLIGAPRVTSLTTALEAKRRARSAEEQRRELLRKTVTGQGVPKSVRAFPLFHSSPRACSAAGCTNDAPMQLCVCCGGAILCRSCDADVRAASRATAVWADGGDRDEEVYADTLKAVWSEARVRRCVTLAAGIKQDAADACAKFTAASVVQAVQLRDSDDALSEDAGVRARAARDVLEAEGAAPCSRVSVRARALLHRIGACNKCVSHSDCNDVPLPTLRYVGTKVSVDTPSAEMYGAVQQLFAARLLVRSTFVEHVSRYRVAADAAVRSAFDGGVAPGVAEVLDGLRAAITPETGLAWESATSSASGGYSGADGGADGVLELAAVHLPPGAVCVHVHSSTKGDIMDGFDSFGAEPLTDAAAADVQRSVHITSIGLTGVVLILVPSNPYVKSDPGRPARLAHDPDLVPLLPVDELLEHKNVDAVAVVFVPARATAGSERPTLILAAFAALTLATVAPSLAARSGGADAPVMDGPEKSRLVDRWSTIVIAASSSSPSPPPSCARSTIKPGYGTAIRTFNGSPMLHANCRTGGANGKLTPTALKQLNVQSVLPGRYMDDPSIAETRGARHKMAKVFGQGAVVPSKPPCVRASNTAVVAVYPQREANSLTTRDGRRAGGGAMMKSGPPVSIPAAALARNVSRCNGDSRADDLARACDVHNVAKLCTALLANALDGIGIPCAEPVHDECLFDVFRRATAIIEADDEGLAAELRVRTRADVARRARRILLPLPQTPFPIHPSPRTRPPPKVVSQPRHPRAKRSLTRICTVHHASQIAARGRMPGAPTCAAARLRTTPDDPERAFALAFARTRGGLPPSQRLRRGVDERAVELADPEHFGFTYAAGVVHAVGTYACVRKRLGRVLSAECNVTIQFTPVCEHVDRNNAKRDGFLESLSSVYVTEIARARNVRAQAPAPLSDRLEGALFMPRARVAVRRRPCWGIHIVFFDREPHSVFAALTHALEFVRGVGGDPDCGIATVADW